MAGAGKLADIEATKPEDYFTTVEDKCCVVVENEKRLASIRQEGTRLAMEKKGVVLWKESLLQEVQGLHVRHTARHPDWPALPQHEFLAEDAWQQTAYGGNAIYDHGHHGNAILSRHLILSTANQDVSDHRF